VRESTSLEEFHPPGCWTGLAASFSWSRAFRLAASKRLRKKHAESMWRILHGIYLAPRRRNRHDSLPECPVCGETTDTRHALVCTHHRAALGWFWAMTDRLAGQAVTRSFEVLLGGTPAAGRLARPVGPGLAWETLRTSFLSALYRAWVNRWVHRSSTRRGVYDGSAVVGATITAVRTAIRLDWRRACDGGAAWVRRDGSVGRTPAARRASERVSEVWCEVGWAELVAEGTRITVTFP
jgi:hypothetical protein